MGRVEVGWDLGALLGVANIESCSLKITRIIFVAFNKCQACLCQSLYMERHDFVNGCP